MSLESSPMSLPNCFPNLHAKPVPFAALQNRSPKSESPNQDIRFRLAFAGPCYSLYGLLAVIISIRRLSSYSYNGLSLLLVVYV